MKLLALVLSLVLISSIASAQFGFHGSTGVSSTTLAESTTVIRALIPAGLSGFVDSIRVATPLYSARLDSVSANTHGFLKATDFADSARQHGAGLGALAKGQPVYAAGADTMYSTYTVTPIFAFGFGSGAASDTTALTATGRYGYWYNKTDSLVITSLMCVMQHGIGTDTMAVQVSWDDSLNGAVVTTLNTAAFPVNSIVTGNEDTSFDNAVIPPGMWVWGTAPGVVAGRKPVSASWVISGYFRKAR